MAERIQPLSDVGPVRHVPAQPRTSARAPSFSELVHAHHAWWRGRQGGTPDPAAEAAYDSMHAAFEARHGEIVRAYWCSDIPSAVALTEKKRLSGRVRSTFGFHRESDWATKNAPDVAAELHRCDALAVRAKAVLTGVRQQICLELVVSCAANLLSLVDKRAPVRRRGEHRGGARPRARRDQQGRVLLLRGGERPGAAHLLRRHRDRDPRHRGSRHRLALHQLGRSRRGARRRRPRGRRERDPADQQRRVRARVRRRRPVHVLPRRPTAAARRRLRDGDHVRLQRRAGPPSRRRRRDTRTTGGFALLVLAFLAGFSERWAQDTLTAIVPASGSHAPAPAGSQASGAAPRLPKRTLRKEQVMSDTAVAVMTDAPTGLAVRTQKRYGWRPDHPDMRDYLLAVEPREDAAARGEPPRPDAGRSTTRASSARAPPTASARSSSSTSSSRARRTRPRPRASSSTTTSG